MTLFFRLSWLKIETSFEIIPCQVSTKSLTENLQNALMYQESHYNQFQFQIDFVPRKLKYFQNEGEGYKRRGESVNCDDC